MSQQNGITYRKLPGLSAQGLRIWGLLFLAFGMVLNPSVQKSLASNEVDFIFTSVGLILQLIHFCAIPIFAFLLVEGFTHTADFVKYILRVAGVAVLAEIPYNLALGGKLLVMDSRNPAFALVLALLMLFLFKHFSERGFVSGVVYVAVTAAAVVWSLMLGIFDGAPLVLLTVVLYALRGKPTLRMILGCVTAFACSIFSLYYMLAPITMILLHFYNGEKGESNPWVDHLSYPAILLVLGIVGNYLI